MPDPAIQLQRLYLAGFQLEQFERYPKAVGVIRDNIVVLLAPTPTGLSMIGAPGWRMGELMGVLVERNGRQGFQYKDQFIEATPERLDALRRFREDLERELAAQA